MKSLKNKTDEDLVEIFKLVDLEMIIQREGGFDAK